MDELDYQIITELQKNAKISYKKLGKMLDAPPSTIHFRIKKLIEDQIIIKFSGIVHIGKLDYKTVGWIGLSTDPLKTESLAKKIALFDEVKMVCATAGAHNIVLQIIAKNEKNLWNFIRRNIQTIEGIKDIDVSSSLKVYKWDTNYYFDISD